MQEYKRQIAYLYAYERGEQLRSTGFVKAEERGGHCRLALHLRGYCHPGEVAGNVYIYFLSSGQDHRDLSWSTEESERCTGMAGRTGCGRYSGKGNPICRHPRNLGQTSWWKGLCGGMG